MVFNSFQYLFFLPTVLLLYWRLPRRAQNALLLVASWLFYAAWDWRFLGLMLLTTVTDFTVGRVMATTDDERRRQRVFAVSLALNLGVLGFFKYFNFFASSAADLLDAVGLQATTPTLRILLPVGISFYTFHGISYTFDVYRRQIEPAHDFLDFAVFVAFFPQLVAGPIGRAHLQLPQFERERPPLQWDQVRSGLHLILLGLFKKVVIADALAPVVNTTFGRASTASWAALLVGAYGFTLQVYGDFSGYSNMARGSSRLFGIELPRNFDQPYLSRNITAFWQTWHISLSTWLRDYLYVPLGGNRGSALATARNLMVTMVLGGLWHGAAWTFVTWGALHGLFLVAHRLVRHRSPKAATDPFTPDDILPALGTFHLVCFALVVFRASSIGDAADYLAGIFTLRGGGVAPGSVTLLAFALTVMFAIDVVQRNAGSHTALLGWPAPARGVVYGAFVVAIVVFSGAQATPFIYFQF